MRLPSVAVLLAVYNGRDYLDAQIRSIRMQQGADVHIFARDDGSSDGSQDMLWSYAQEDPQRFTVVTDGGPSDGTATSNFFKLLAAIDCERFDFVAFSDQDDVWLPSKLDRAIGLLDDKAGGYSSNLLAYDLERGESWLLCKSNPQVDFDYLFQGASAGCTYVLDSSSAHLVATVLANAQPALPAGASHDWIVYAILRSRGVRWTMDDQAHIVYRQHSRNVYGARPGLTGLASKVRLARQGWYRSHVAWLANAVVNSPAETAILNAVQRLSIADRARLAMQAGRFRRTGRDRLMLRIALLAGLF